MLSGEIFRLIASSSSSGGGPQSTFAHEAFLQEFTRCSIASWEVQILHAGRAADDSACAAMLEEVT